MIIWQYIFLIISIAVILANALVVFVMFRSLTTGSYQKYIVERYGEQGRQHDENMRKIRKELDNDHT